MDTCTFPFPHAVQLYSACCMSKKPGKNKVKWIKKKKRKGKKDGIQRTLVFVEMIWWPTIYLIYVHSNNSLYGKQTSSTINFSYNQKSKVCGYTCINYIPCEHNGKVDLALPCQYKPYLLVLSWWSQVPLPRCKVKPGTKTTEFPLLNGNQISPM